MKGGIIVTQVKTVTFEENKIDKVIVDPGAAAYKTRGWGAGLVAWSKISGW